MRIEASTSNTRAFYECGNDLDIRSRENLGAVLPLIYVPYLTILDNQQATCFSLLSLFSDQFSLLPPSLYASMYLDCVVLILPHTTALD